MRASLLLEWTWIWVSVPENSPCIGQRTASRGFPVTNHLRAQEMACGTMSPRSPPLLGTPVVAIFSLSFSGEHFVVALFDYAAVNDRDLQVLKGEKLQILRR